MPENQAQLVQDLIDRGVLRTPVIIEAFQAIDRRDFVPENLASAAYRDIPLPLGLGQTISQPYTVAYMLELLQPQPGHNILDIGYGSGWQTALLAHIASQPHKTKGHAPPRTPRRAGVTALEIVPQLCTYGKANIAKYNFIQKGIVTALCQSGEAGYPPAAPFDRIIAAAASSSDVPEVWLNQIKEGGRIVLPVQNSLVLLIKKERGFEREEHPGFVFVPLVRKKGN